MNKSIHISDRYSILRKHRFIVFGTDHFNLLGIIRSLGENGFNPDVVVIATTSVLLASSRYISSIKMVSNAEEGIKYIIAEFGKDREKPIILTGSDSVTSLLNVHYNDLISKFYFFNTGKERPLQTVMEKEIQLKVAAKHGLNSPNSIIVKRGDLPECLNYPIITKALNSFNDNWKNNVYICRNKHELEEAYKSITDEFIILQEYIDKKNELALQGISVRGGEDWYAPANIHFYRFYDDAYGNYFYYVPFNHPEIIDKITAFLRDVGYSGVFEMEFLIDKNDRLYFMETNFRHSAWNHSTTSLGFNLPLEWAKAEIENSPIEKQGISLKKMPFSAMMELSEFTLNVIQSKRVSIWRYLKDLSTADCLLIWNNKDPKPFWALIKDKLNRIFK